jgi:hypothetical protein
MTSSVGQWGKPSPSIVEFAAPVFCVPGTDSQE